MVTNMKKINSAFLILFLTSSGLAANAPLTAANKQCVGANIANEPMAKIRFYSAPEYRSAMQTPEAKQLFNPSYVDAVNKAAQPRKEAVSSSHLVNLVAEALESIQADTDKAIIRGELVPVVSGRMYSANELIERNDKLNNYREKKIKPVIEGLFKTYLSALRQLHIENEKKRDLNELQKLTLLATGQEKFLNALIAKLQPSILEKLGMVRITAKDSLPVSYRNGYVVKIRFQKNGEDEYVSVYPRLLISLLTGKEQGFIDSLRRWRDYAQSQADALVAETETGTVGGYFKFYAGLLHLPFSTSPNAKAQQTFLVEEAASNAAKDYDRALWVQKRIATLTDKEIYSLLELFNVLRLDDMPRCQAAVQMLDQSVTRLMGGESLRGKLVSNDKRFTPAQQSAINQAGKDAIFYRDMYDVFSTASALMLTDK
jgi:hypothetical protein